MIDGAALARMKPGAILVTAARGGLVDESALVTALPSGHPCAAGLDVSPSPVPPDDPLLALDNVVLMPQIAWLTPETLGRSLDIAIENMLRLRHGSELLHRGSLSTAIEIGINRCQIRCRNKQGRRMRTTVTVDDELLANAAFYTGIKEKSALIRHALKTLVEREAARRLARLGGSEPDLKPITRRRTGRG